MHASGNYNRGKPWNLPKGLPEPGEQPPDLEATRADVIAMWEASGDPSLSKQERAQYQEDPEVWLDATLRFEEEHPDYAAIAKTVHNEVDEVVFTAPDRASVRYQLVSESSMVPRYQIGVAVLAADGTWRVATETSCRLIELSGTQCGDG